MNCSDSKKPTLTYRMTRLVQKVESTRFRLTGRGERLSGERRWDQGPSSLHLPPRLGGLGRRRDQKKERRIWGHLMHLNSTWGDPNGFIGQKSWWWWWAQTPAGWEVSDHNSSPVSPLGSEYWGKWWAKKNLRWFEGVWEKLTYALGDHWQWPMCTVKGPLWRGSYSLRKRPFCGLWQP